MPKDLLQARKPRPYVVITEGWIIRQDDSRIHAEIPVIEYHGDDIRELLNKASGFTSWHYVIRIRMEEFGSI